MLAANYKDAAVITVLCGIETRSPVARLQLSSYIDLCIAKMAFLYINKLPVVPVTVLSNNEKYSKRVKTPTPHNAVI